MTDVNAANAEDGKQIESVGTIDAAGEAVAKVEGSTGSAKIVYILYIIGIVFGLTGIVGVIMAYINKGDDEVLDTHYQFQIRTFWMGLMYLVLGALLAIVLVGYFILLWWIVWLAIRSVKGMKYLDRGEAHPNPTSWLFG